MPARVYLDAGAVPDGKTVRLLLCVLVAGLLLDWLVPFWGQVMAGAMTWTLFLVLYRAMPESAKQLMMSCLVLATLGEIFCSLVWQLYDYRLLSIPFYVPPGHVIVFLLGSALAPRMPRSVVWMVPFCVVPYVAMGFWFGFDGFGIVLFAMFLACLIAEQDRRLYATMFLLCLLLEVAGTMLGNWTWKAEVPFWGLSTTNPPVSAGTFYCLLDFLMLRFVLAGRAGRAYLDGMGRLFPGLAEFVRPLAWSWSRPLLLPVATEDLRERMIGRPDTSVTAED